MGDYLKQLGEYLNTLQKNLDTGKATEPSHYPTLKILGESLGEGLTVLNNPKWIDCGAPDFLISKGSTTVGYIEAKDIGKSLDEAEKTDQLKRYRDSLTNLILTDYLEFRWYTVGERRLSARLGTLTKDGKVKRDKEGVQKVAELLTAFLAHEAEGVGTPRELAERMARLAHMIRDLIINAFKKEPESGSMHSSRHFGRILSPIFPQSNSLICMLKPLHTVSLPPVARIPKVQSSPDRTLLTYCPRRIHF